MTYALVAFLVLSAVVVGFMFGRSSVTVVHEEKPLSTFKSNILESYETWEEEAAGRSPGGNQ